MSHSTEPGVVNPSSPAADVHDAPFVYPTSGIAEGHARVPRWLALVILGLFAFYGWYIATQWNAQTTSAQMKK